MTTGPPANFEVRSKEANSYAKELAASHCKDPDGGSLNQVDHPRLLENAVAVRVFGRVVLLGSQCSRGWRLPVAG